jgi:hypothetical protein
MFRCTLLRNWLSRAGSVSVRTNIVHDEKEYFLLHTIYASAHAVVFFLAHSTLLSPALLAQLEGASWFAPVCARWEALWGMPTRAPFKPTVAEKVAALCALDAAPKHRTPVLARRGDATVEFDGGGFLANVRQNWKEGGKPNTPLLPALLAQLECAIWFASVRARWENKWTAARTLDSAMSDE